MNKPFNISLIWLALAAVLLAGVGPGAGAGAEAGAAGDTKQQVLDRMKARVPALQEQKKAGKVGEVWNGQIDAVKPEYAREATVAKLIADENADRKKLFEIIAKEQGSTAEAAGEAFGKTAFDRAAKGDWLKGKDGVWKQKA